MLPSADCGAAILSPTYFSRPSWCSKVTMEDPGSVLMTNRPHDASNRGGVPFWLSSASSWSRAFNSISRLSGHGEMPERTRRKQIKKRHVAVRENAREATSSKRGLAMHHCLRSVGLTKGPCRAVQGCDGPRRDAPGTQRCTGRPRRLHGKALDEAGGSEEARHPGVCKGACDEELRWTLGRVFPASRLLWGGAKAGSGGRAA